MSEEKITSGKNERSAAEGAERIVFSWRQKLIDRVLKIITLVLLPVAAGSAYTLSRAGDVGLTFVVVMAYLVLVISALIPRLPYRWRVGGLLTALFILGAGDLLLLGWEMNVHLMLMTVSILAIIFGGSRSGYITLGCVSVTLLAFVIAERLGAFPALAGQARPGVVGWVTLLSEWALFTILGVVILASLDYLYPRMVRVIDQLRDRVQGVEAEREELQERLEILQASNLNFQRRAMYLEASLEVSQVLSTLFEVEPLLDRAVNLITQHFGFYHTGIFLMDDAGEWAVLRAASSAGGRRMLTKGHRLRRGSDSMVGWVVEHRQPRIAADVGADAVHFENPDLPATRSEIALPLMVAGRVIGVLDVQSTEGAAFDRDDVRALEGMAGQLSVAITNAQRLSEEAALLEASSPFYRLARRLATARTEREIHTAILSTSQDFNPMRSIVVRGNSERGDQQISPSADRSLAIAAEMRRGELYIPEQQALAAGTASYYAHVIRIARAQMELLLIADLSDPPEALAASASLRQVVAESMQTMGARSLALIPIRVEERLLGALIVLYNTVHEFAPLETRLYRVLGDMGGVALERTRLAQISQTRLEQERWVREFAGRLMHVPDVQAIMSEAATSLQTLAEADGVIVSLTPEAPEAQKTPTTEEL